VVFNGVSEVGNPYTPVADLTTNEGGPDIGASDKQVQGSQTKKAASLGANGIIRGATRNKALAIFIPADSGRAIERCARRQHGSTLPPNLTSG